MLCCLLPSPPAGLDGDLAGTSPDTSTRSGLLTVTLGGARGRPAAGAGGRLVQLGSDGSRAAAEAGATSASGSSSCDSGASEGGSEDEEGSGSESGWYTEEEPTAEDLAAAAAAAGAAAAEAAPGDGEVLVVSVGSGQGPRRREVRLSSPTKPPPAGSASTEPAAGLAPPPGITPSAEGGAQQAAKRVSLGPMPRMLQQHLQQAAQGRSAAAAAPRGGPKGEEQEAAAEAPSQQQPAAAQRGGPEGQQPLPQREPRGRRRQQQGAGGVAAPPGLGEQQQAAAAAKGDAQSEPHMTPEQALAWRQERILQVGRWGMQGRGLSAGAALAPGACWQSAAHTRWPCGPSAAALPQLSRRGAPSASTQAVDEMQHRGPCNPVQPTLLPAACPHSGCCGWSGSWAWRTAAATAGGERAAPGWCCTCRRGAPGRRGRRQSRGVDGGGLVHSTGEGECSLGFTDDCVSLGCYVLNAGWAFWTAALCLHAMRWQCVAVYRAPGIVHAHAHALVC